MRRALVAAIVLAALVALASARPAKAAGDGPYYVALGDSLADGGGATPGHSYVDDVYAAAQQSIPGLQLENLSCSGDSTTRMINGGLCTTYTTGNQLGDAEAFLRAHAGHIAFVTIDVGGDDVIGCGVNGTLNMTCFNR